jgi:selenocysteine-specific elongation factor
MEGDQILEGQTGLAQVKTADPVVAGPRDRFIIRSLSPVDTIGGGMIVEAVARRLRRTRADVLDDLRTRAAAVASEGAFAEYCLRDAGADGATAADLASRAKLPRDEVQTLLQSMIEDGTAAATGPRYVHVESLARGADAVKDAVRAYHAEHPKSPGIDADTLREATGLPAALFTELLQGLVARAELRAEAGRIALPDHHVGFSPEEQAQLDAIESLFRDAPFAPPRPADAAEASGLPADRARWAATVLLENGRLVQVEDDLVFHADAVAEAQRRLEDYLRTEGRLESVKFKYLLDTSRKFAIPLLDYFDRVGVTSRVGHTRYLREQ